MLKRRGSSAGMMLQLKDCVTGGVFQLEPKQQTVVKQQLAPCMSYFVNPLTGKVNFGNGAVIGKDSPQVATKIAEDRAAGTSAWRIEAGGRLGMVFGEDGVEPAPPAPTCTSHCQVQDQVRGSLPAPGGETVG